jgi:hypothetical protein
MKNKLFLITSLLIINGSLISQVPNYVPQNGLSGWWPFNGNADDESNNGNDGIVYDANLTQDRYGNPNSAYNFNGVSDYIEVLDDNSLDFTNSYSLSAWYRTTDNFAYNQTILGKGNDIGGSGYNMTINSAIISYDNLQIQSGFNNGLEFVDGVINGAAMIPSVDIFTINWHHIIGTYDGNTAKLYIDGVLMDTIQIEFSLSISEQPLLFGNETNTLYRYFEGDIDDIGMWNRALTNDEVLKLHRASSPETSTNTSGHIINNFDINLDIYPNPTIDVVNIDFHDLNKFEGGKVKIMNMSGQIVYEENITQSKMTISVVDRFSKGIYIVTTTDSDGNILSNEKMIVQ